jgi:hypothetical protein
VIREEPAFFFLSPITYHPSPITFLLFPRIRKDSTVKRIIRSTLSILTAVTLFSFTVSLSLARGAADHGFSVKEYEEFHDVLHPLEHEALPNNDFKTIRAKAAELVTRGEAILKLGVPRGVEQKHVEDFKEWLKRFSAALLEFKRDAGNGTDEQLKESYSAVHDSFEMLAAMLPRK